MAKICSVEKCGRTRVSDGLCSKHYREKHGKSYMPKNHRKDMDKKQQPEPTPILDNLLLKTKQAKKQEKYQDKVVGYMTTIGKLSDRCDELNNQVIELQTLISVLRHERTDLKAECYDMLRKAWVEK